MKDLRTLYEECRAGADPVSVAYVCGNWLNEELQTTEYDPDQVYVLTEQGIGLFGPEDDLKP